MGKTCSFGSCNCQISSSMSLSRVVFIRSYSSSFLVYTIASIYILFAPGIIQSLLFCSFTHKVNYLSTLFNKTVTKSSQTVTNFFYLHGFCKDGGRIIRFRNRETKQLRSEGGKDMVYAVILGYIAAVAAGAALVL